MPQCMSIGCNSMAVPEHDFCAPCLSRDLFGMPSLSTRYPTQYKNVGDLEEIDPYAIHHLFQIKDPSGCLQQASLALLMTGSSTSIYQDVSKARDLLTRWLQLNQELNK